MVNKRIICALIGLVGAISNNEKTENTDLIVKRALLSEDNDEIIQLIHNEKFIISPNCATCQFPCGNTSDYDENKLENEPEDIHALKLEIIDLLKEKVQERVDDRIYKAIAYLGYELEKQSYFNLLQELKND